MKAYITVTKKEIRHGRIDYTETLKALSNKFKDSSETLIFSPLQGNLIDVVNYLTENQISYHLRFKIDEEEIESTVM